MKELLKRTFESRFNEGNYKELTVNLFNRFDFSREHTLKNQFNEIEKQALEDFTYVGTYEDIGKKRLDILVVELKGGSKVERARSLQRNLIGKYLKNNLSDAALVAFYSKDNPDWRFSFVKIDYRLNEKGIKVEIGTPPKRYSFLVGKTEPSHTAQKQLLPLLDDKIIQTLEDIEKAFSIEKVTKEFYNQIALMFTKLVGGERKIGSKTIQEAGLLKYPQPSDTVRKEFAVRLIGRLLFCWFLKKKKSENGEPLIPSATLSSDAIKASPFYYHSLLEPLFFQVLNTPIDKRLEQFINEPWDKIPFLNGGLFEPHQHDFYEIDPLGTSRYLNILRVPDDWLSELFKIFEEYNFTIDESTTIDIDISVDPEMLGRIFENLLAEINPETGETARKSTGSYYTPRPIVEYMVDESLKQYLKTSLTTLSAPSPLVGEGRGEGDSLDTKLSRLLSYADWDIDLTESEKDAIIDALDRVKIIDPACGSGAFPMGILHKMLLILQKIDPQSKKWLSRKLARIDNKLLRHEVETKLKRENWDYVHKLGIIQNSIYGIDIQPIAVEISKLRFFLSLVVDETIDDSKPNRGIVPLPNLEFKFVAANSLIGLPKAEGGFAESHEDIEKLRGLREAYFTAFGDEKRRVEREFKETQNRMFMHALNWQAIESQTYKLSEWNPFSDQASSWFDPEWMFGVRGGFDVVIANPPYIGIEDISWDLRRFYETIFETATGRFDLYSLFIEKAMQIKLPSGVFAFIIPGKFLNNKQFITARKIICENHGVTVVKIDDKVFDASQVDSVIVENYLPVKSSKPKYKAFKITGQELQLLSETEVETILQDKEIIFRLEINTKFDKLISKIKENTFRMRQIGEVKDGIVAGAIKDILFLDKKLDKDSKKLYFGKHLSKYHLADTNVWVNYKPDEMMREEIKRQGTKRPGLWMRDKNIFEREKIIYRKVGKEIIAAYCEKGIYYEQTIHSAHITDKRFKTKYVLGLFNSILFKFYYQKTNSHGGNIFPQVRISSVENLPIKLADNITQEKIVKLVDQILSLKQANPGADTTALEREIDKMVYKLYDFTPEEIEIIDNSK